MRFVVGVMGPAKAAKKDLDNARVLGEFIARRGWVVLTGGRNVGVMDAACEGAKRVGGSLTIGVLPTAKDKVSAMWMCRSSRKWAVAETISMF